MVSYQQQTGTNKRYGMLRCICRVSARPDRLLVRFLTQLCWRALGAGSRRFESCRPDFDDTAWLPTISSELFLIEETWLTSLYIREFDNRRALIRHRRAVAKTFYVKTLRGSNLAVWVPIWLQDWVG